MRGTDDPVRMEFGRASGRLGDEKKAAARLPFFVVPGVLLGDLTLPQLVQRLAIDT